jgi:uncharacterized protein YggT (Ycf19 family)
MGLVDLILNLAALLLWVHWREMRHAQKERPDRHSLAGLLKYTGRKSHRHWWLLIMIPAVLLVRGLIFQSVGPSLHWTPRLSLELVTLPFYSHFVGRMLSYSILNFLLLLGRFYVLLIFFSVVNRGTLENDVIQRWVRVQLGRMERWPFWAQILLILLVGLGTWIAAAPLLRHLNITPSDRHLLRTAVEGVLLGIAALLNWRYLVAGLMVLYFANTYIYFGRSPLWNFVQVTGQNLLRPLRSLPLQMGKLDLRPLVMLVLVGLVAYGCRLALEKLYFYLPRWI